MAAATLRVSVATSALTGLIAIAVGLALSWLATYLIGGAGQVVPHFYYVPILFAAVRFGPIPALVVAVLSGVLAGPFTPLDVMTGEAQELHRWMSRAVFFVVIGVGMSLLVRPSLPSVTDEIRRLRDAHRLRHAIDEGELFLRYQPIVDLSSGGLYGFEALVRWQHPDDGELPPGVFLPAAEASEVIHELGAFVLREASMQAARWAAIAADRGIRPPCVTVNMSARELESPDVVRRVRDTINEAGVDPSMLCLEITESALVDDVDLSAATIAALKTLGVKIAIDDFGTGYSSFASVHRYPVDVLKIDRAFIRTLETDPDIESMLGGLVMFAHSLDLTTIVEGVETHRQAEIVSELGFDHAQGFLFARPMDVDDAGELLGARYVTERLGTAWLDAPRAEPEQAGDTRSQPTRSGASRAGSSASRTGSSASRLGSKPADSAGSDARPNGLQAREAGGPGVRRQGSSPREPGLYAAEKSGADWTSGPSDPQRQDPTISSARRRPMPGER